MDSTAGAHTGQKKSIGHPIETPSGKVGNAQDFVPDDGISVADTDAFTMNDGTHDVPFTLEVWMYATVINNHHTLLAKDGQNRREWYLQTYGYESYPRFIYMLLLDNNGVEYIQDKYYYEFQPNEWYQITVTYDGSQSESGLTLFFNGQPVTWSETKNTGYGMMHNTNVPVFMGKYDWPGESAKYYYGILDEVRISKEIVRSSGWISTSYMNQNDPGSFISIGPEVPGP